MFTLQEQTILAVPADTTVLVKTLYGYAYASTTGALNLVIALPPASGFAAVSLDLQPGKGYRWDGWLALDPGWRMSLYNGTGAGVDYVVSGTVLQGVAQDLPLARD